MNLNGVICKSIDHGKSVGHAWQGKPHIVYYKNGVWMVYEDRCRRCGYKMDFLERFL